MPKDSGPITERLGAELRRGAQGYGELSETDIVPVFSGPDAEGRPREGRITIAELFGGEPPGGGGGGGGGGEIDDSSGTTVDTGEEYRIIMLSTGLVRAVPYDAVPPDTPENVAALARLTSVRLTWDAAALATSYQITRNGSILATTSLTSYRDRAVTISQTYTYTVSSIDQYLQRSPASDPVTAFIDPALNQTPSDVTITMWPTPLPTDGWSYVRVNAQELDVQDLAFELEVDVGSLTSTPDPSTWILRI
jgi:hypothetical protein